MSLPKFGLSAFKDAAKVAEDVADVAAQFKDVPPALGKLASDVYSAVVAGDVTALTQLIKDGDTLFRTVRADGVQAADAISTLLADLETLLADLS